MKNSYLVPCTLVMIGLALTIKGLAQPALKDSVIISFNEQTKMVIYGTDRKEIEKLSQYDFNRLIRDVLSKLDSVSPSGGVSRDWVDGKIYLKDDSAKSEKGGLNLPKRRTGDGESTRIGYVRGEENGESVIRVTQTIKEGNGHAEIVTDTVWVRHPWKRTRRSPRQGIDVKLGLNTYGEKNMAGYDPDNLNLRPGASRYVSIGLIRSFSVVNGKKNNLFMDLGLDVSWYNLMFEGNDVIRKENSGVVFTNLFDSDGSEVNLRRSKLVSPHVNLSMMPTFTFAGTVLSHLSAGMYAGYRIGGYHVSRPVEGPKSKVSSDFHMQQVRYGMAFEVGIRSFPDLFVNYDMNSLFDLGKGPQVRMLSFGLRM